MKAYTYSYYARGWTGRAHGHYTMQEDVIAVIEFKCVECDVIATRVHGAIIGWVEIASK